MAGATQASETTTLLTPEDAPTEQGQLDRSDDGYGTNAEDTFKRHPEVETTWQRESVLLLRYAAPLLATYLLQYSFNVVTVFVAGHLGTQELGAASLASMTANITGLCVYEGLATSLDTLASQAFGAGKKKLVGLHVQRMIAFLILVTIPIGALWICSPWILEALVPAEEKEVAQLAGHFLRIYLVGAPGYATFEAGKRFTQAQGFFVPSMVVLLVCAPLHIFNNWLFVWKLHLGFTGAAMAVALSNNLLPLLLLLYVQTFARSTLECWHPLQLRRVFTRWTPMIALALPGVAMVFCEWLAFEILTFSASYLSTAHLAAQSVLMSVCVTMYHIPFPISIAASTRFGQLIGHGALRAARTAFRTYYTIFIAIGLINMAILTSLRHAIPVFFTPDPVVRGIITSIIPIVAADQFFDATTILSNALLRGLGRQKFGGWLNFAVYYTFAVPLSLGLAFGAPQLGLTGLWVGPVSGLAVCTFALVGYMTCWTSWEGAVEEARGRGE